MLSAAAAVLCASAMAALADTTVSTNTSTALVTTTAGNITIDSSGAVAVKNGGAAVTLDSNNFVLNNGVIQNGDNDNAIGVLIDTTDHDVVAQSGGLTSTNTISVAGSGLGKSGLLITGGNRFFGNITLNNATPLSLTGAGASLTVSGTSVFGVRMTDGSIVDGDIGFGGSMTAIAPDTKTTGNSAPIMVYLAGKVNGNVLFDETVASSTSGDGAQGVAILGGLHACSSDAAAEASAGFTCGTGTSGLGALINNGKIVTVGQVFVNPASKDPVLEGGSTLMVGASIDGGIFNGGPYTANSVAPVGVFSGNGANGNAVVYIDPNLAGTEAAPLHIGPVSSALDSIDAGYSFDNRGSITAAPSAPQVSTVSMFVQGASPNLFTCFGNGTSLTDCGGDGLGGILNTGTISANATTNATGVVASQVTASALVIGPYAAVPRIDLKAEDTGLGSTTPGTIYASVSGTSGGIATALSISQNANVPLINVGKGASIKASVSTTNLAPTAEQTSSSSPFTLVATAITDGSSTLKTINNAGIISAAISIVTPGVGADIVTSVRAIDLTSSVADGITINNSGQILGDLNFGAGGNNYTLNVGNTGTNGGSAVANPATGFTNSPNSYAVIAYSIDNQVTGAAPTTTFNTINFGAGTGHVLHVGAFGYVNSVIKSSAGALDVTVDTNGTLFVANTDVTGSLNAHNFDVNGGTLGLTISQNTTATTPVIRASNEATIQANSNVALQFGSFVASSTSHVLADYTSPNTQRLVLISAPTVNVDDATLAQQNLVLSQNLPFLFQPDSTPLTKGSAGGNQTLELALTPRSPGEKNPDGTPGLGLTGDALAQFPFVASALATDPSLGAAIASSLTVYNTPGQASSGINVAASQQKSQAAFSQFGPDTSGGARQVAILITDQASGPVAARQRLLRRYDNVAGDLTLWGTEFAGNINNKGRVDADGTLTNYKDHGFGFSLGLDSGSPRGGWYGGAFTFYSGDVTQTLPRDTKTQTTWYMLSGYTSWKGRHLFLDTQLSAAYGNFNGTRDLTIGSTVRTATGKRAGLMGALGANMGATFNAGPLQIAPHLSLDGLTMREEGYSETGGGSGFDLQVAPYYASSLRTALGLDISTGLNIFGVTMTPEARVGYRYDLLNSPVKLRAAFIGTATPGTTALNTVGNSMTFVGPDPDTGNLVGGLSLWAGTDTWNLGVHYDYLRGNNGSVSQVGTISLLGRI
jgi:hypothetical protein